MDMSWHVSVGSLWACVKVDNYCDTSLGGTLTHINSLENICGCVSATDVMSHP
jgi:hypothetical protein